jgi:exosortase/archaeosortase family protein
MGLEQSITQGLMRVTAALTVECAGWFGIPCVQHGNVIETTAGLVGIDEACSGVRSLQAALMLSLFLGEMQRFAVLRRLVLIGASLLFDLLANLTRTSFLVWAAANKGLAQMETWHDAAGALVMIIVLPGLLFLAHLLKFRTRSVNAVPVDGPRVPRSVPGWVGIGALVWIAVGEVSSEVWYRLHETRLIPAARWSVDWPTRSFHFKSSGVPQKALSILRCSDSEAAAWEDVAGNQWSGFLLRWKPGKNSAQLAKGHRPEICFPASGAQLLNDYGQVTVPVQDFKLPFRHQAFDMGNRTVHVFYCLWPDRVAPNEKPLLEDGSHWSRLQAVLSGKRHLGQQVLELVVAGPESQAEAFQALRLALPSLIHSSAAH